MGAKLKTVAETGLQFFGEITASNSHEIKNILAIINENAGLLEDLALMYDRGAQIEPQRLKNMSGVVMKQIRRADTIVKNMNRLAKSIDESGKKIDLNEILELVVALSQRFAAVRDVRIDPEFSENPMMVRTSPFVLMNLLWLCLVFAMDAAGEDKIVELGTEKARTGFEVYFKRIGGLAGALLKPFPTEPEESLCKLLGAELEVSPANREIVVKIAEVVNRD